MSFFIIGIFIGIVSLIPGISSGTIILISGKSKQINETIKNYKKNIFKIITLGLGIITGAFSFAKIVEYLFQNHPAETLLMFIGFILFSIPNIKRKQKINIIYFLLGMLIVGFIYLLVPKTPKVYNFYPKNTIPFLFSFGICGFIDGFLTIIPGISGSMVMMILGPYYLFKSYLANFSIINIKIIIPLTFYFLGDIIGIYNGAKISLKLFEENNNKGMSLIIGFIAMSLIIIFPWTYLLSFKNIFKSIIILFISIIISKILQLISQN